MKLFYSPASPYARKVRIAALEKGINLELISTVTADNPPELHAANPSGKIPALITDDGTSLAESHHICHWLETAYPEPALFPKTKDALLACLHRDAIAIGIMDATVRIVIESRRPQEKQHEAWHQRQLDAITRSLAVLEAEINDCSKTPSIDQISIATALDYLTLRLPTLSWQTNYPKLSEWFQKVRTLDSFQQTSPHESDAQPVAKSA